MAKLLLILSLVLFPLIQGYSLPPYENCRIINDALKFKFYWNTSTDGFYGAVESTFGSGYAALGVASSTTKSMTSNGAGSDAWIFYFSGGVPKSADGWMTSHDNPRTDTNHLQVLGGGVTTGSLKAVDFYRKYNTGDSMDSVVEPTKLVNFIYAAHPNSPVIVGPSEIEMEEHGTSRCGLVGIILSAHSSCDPVQAGGGPSFTAPDGTFRANWTLTSTDITFMMSGLGTGGYVAMGWNMGGGMTNADMVVGWLDSSNNAVVSDRWSPNKNMPVEDTSNGGRNDVANAQGYVETFNGAQWTTFIFTRPLNSGDNSDIAIVNGPMHLLYAVGQSGSVNYGANTFQQHSSKGDVVVNFFDLNGTVVVSPPPPPSPAAAGNSTGGNTYASPDGTFKASWVINGPHITFTMSGVTSTGWVGIGWNTKGGMPNTDMVVGWLDSTGAAVALDTWATKRDIPTVDTALGGDSYLLNVSGLVEKIDGKKWMTISFTRPLQITDKYDISIADQQYHMLWAVGPDASVNYAAKTYNQHSTEGEVLVNFFSSNALCEAASAAANPYFKAHGILMISGWTMMLFVGTYIARYMKPVTNLWFKVHVALQTIGCFAVIAAFVLILVFYNGGFTVGWHQMIGLFVVIGTVVQPIIGAIADKMYDPARSKVPVWPDQIHWWIGRGTSLLALAAIFLGIWVYMPTSLVSYILFAAYCLLTFIIILVSELKVGVKHENEVYTEDMQIAEGKVKKQKVLLSRNLFWAWIAIGFLILIALIIFIALFGLDAPVC